MPQTVQHSGLKSDLDRRLSKTDEVDRLTKSVIIGASAGATLSEALAGVFALGIAIPIVGAVTGAAVSFLLSKKLEESRK
jgi:hypothetical protein